MSETEELNKIEELKKEIISIQNEINSSNKLLALPFEQFPGLDNIKKYATGYLNRWGNKAASNIINEFNKDPRKGVSAAALYAVVFIAPVLYNGGKDIVAYVSNKAARQKAEAILRSRYEEITVKLYLLIKEQQKLIDKIWEENQQNEKEIQNIMEKIIQMSNRITKITEQLQKRKENN